MDENTLNSTIDALQKRIDQLNGLIEAAMPEEATSCSEEIQDKDGKVQFRILTRVLLS
jgi:hypothetical protein